MSVKNGTEPRTDYLPPPGLRGKVPEPDVLTADQLAERWQTSRDHIYDLAARGDLDSVKFPVGRKVRFSLAKVREYELSNGGQSAAA
jgi:excisionase family DNA binding protein